MRHPVIALATSLAALTLFVPVTELESRAVTVRQAPDRALAERLDAIVDEAIADRRIVGAVILVARDGRVVYRRAAGLSDREAGRPMREDAIFRLASVSKPIVTAAAMRLIEQGTLALDDPVTKWLPDFRPALADGTRPVITVRHLLTHMSGLSYAFAEAPEHAYHRLGVSDGMDVSEASLDENVRRIGQGPLAFAPGSAWHYSLSIDVLGAVMARAAGSSLPEIVASTVTGPLGMADTGFVTTDAARLTAAYVDGSPAPARMTDGLEVPIGAGAVRFAPSRALDAAAFPSGGAGMVGTARDLLAFFEAVRRGGAPILDSSTVQEMMRNQLPAGMAGPGAGSGFGYGWAVVDDPAAEETPQGRGTIRWGGVYGHSWFVDPESRLTVVALTNTTFEGMNGRFTTELRDALYGR